MKNKNILSTIFGCIACATIINVQGEYQITPKPTEVTILAIQNGKVFDENWSVFQEAFKDTNIKLKGVGSKNQTDEIQAFNLAVASGDLSLIHI